jgi:succinate dehydrogenase / fumarate reductase, cytochrome b subunit
MAQQQPRPNLLGIWGWVYGGKYQIERYLYILHRVTGVGLAFFILFHFTATTVFRMQGQGVWEATMGILENPILKFGEYLVAVAFVYHAVNGLRLFLQELGFALGKPVVPIFPYKDSIRKKRPLTIVLVVIIVILAVITLYDFIAGGW